MITYFVLRVQIEEELGEETEVAESTDMMINNDNTMTGGIYIY